VASTGHVQIPDNCIKPTFLENLNNNVDDCRHVFSEGESLYSSSEERPMDVSVEER